MSKLSKTTIVKWGLIASLSLTACGVVADPNKVQQSLLGSGKLPLTGGLPNIDGVGGGGITASALIAGYGTEDQIGGFAQYAQVTTDDFKLTSQSVGVSFYNRFELSLSKSTFDTDEAGARLGLGFGYQFDNSSLNLKVRLLGDAVLDQDTWVPQISAGWQKKESDNEEVLALIGAADSEDNEFYLSATKLYLESGILANFTLRHSNANQNGILGFGGDKNADKEWLAEGFVAYLLTDKLAAGFEYKQNPDNLNLAGQDDWSDIFILYTPTKNMSFAAAYADLGDVVLQGQQDGFYFSATFQF